ncbi:hypothetical protein RHSIM_Rhsim03G0129900 [Rhododendron simsii]|uniref:Uncharacterized protein n=1 Tax=Rhododendron simsii TaxID=118357 RepID=A0A834H4W5_RHOSS|nr:hypothetical protein RHSIM_Rhsim03G0129900 [Rhododendron simsii]
MVRNEVSTRAARVFDLIEENRKQKWRKGLVMTWGSVSKAKEEDSILSEQMYTDREVTEESDYKQAILLSVSELVPPWDVAVVVLDIRDLAKASGNVFSWEHQVTNKAAYTVTALAKSGNLPCNWVICPPLSLLPIFTSDAIS